MCKLAHGSAYVHKMFTMLSAKELKTGSDTLSLGSIAIHSESEVAGDTKASKDTKQAVMSSVFAAKSAVDGIVKGDYANPFVVQRPPATTSATRAARSTRSQGFCFANGAAIAAQYYLQKHPGARVTIIDCELTLPPALQPITPRLSRTRLRDSRSDHGNGTQSSCSTTCASSSSTTAAATSEGQGIREVLSGPGSTSVELSTSSTSSSTTSTRTPMSRGSGRRRWNRPSRSSSRTSS